MENENERLKRLVADHQLANQMNDELLKKTLSLGEKVELIGRFVAQGMQAKAALLLAGVSRHQYYYKPKQGRQGRKPTNTTRKLEGGRVIVVPDSQVGEDIHKLKQDPHTDHGCRKTAHMLMLQGYYIGP